MAIPDATSPRLPVLLGVDQTEGELALTLSVQDTLFWFQGHFPGLPVLPGVVQIDWALAFARSHLALGPVVSQSLQVKFRAAVRPGDTLVLHLRHDPRQHRLTFSYRRGGQLCSTGHMGLLS
ncbi:MAG: hypothetical protein HQL87_03170 [Magnetococcales bacterium]|nr:hypothetical protein [Magnetococcales bacterium]